MNAELPDVSIYDIAQIQSPLAWVGMQGIDLPLAVVESGYDRILHARIDAHVNLPRPETKGIHMSRLYRLLDILSEGDGLAPAKLRLLLESMIESHADCGSSNARLRIAFDLLVRRSALVTDGLSGWKSYPVQLEVSVIDGSFSGRVEVRVTYSSTCPCSAALSRQVVEQGFRDAFAGKEAVTPDEVATWLSINASQATPHSQRSEAHVSLEVAADASDFGLLDLIDRIENAVKTPVQTAVKRSDEQAFAVLNGQNLMFVEDAARRIEAALYDQMHLSVYVRHIESLHPHDAVAYALPNRPVSEMASRQIADEVKLQDS
ncbi:GTP cyclohydrolase FolE2 [Cohaesibacter celericrescens]|uniref:GTP cyclohydrolase FolE2 n=1 Tax=Cohaesibacter celericrescens TaxID=2067669 RepID=A0A2N5XRS6_9HYPH|nr:GTP cyclohydrolase FolE2 [Cohaesibacter celericrescens]PLW77165.1 GTP cyclohydrolase I FolE2 [Cohaesibacter celericrescens]